MSTPAHVDEPPRDARRARSGKPAAVPAPPGGHALRIDPDAARQPHPVASMPVVDEVSAGGLVTRIHDGRPEAAVIARRNRGGRLEWCLPKGHLEGSETPEEAAVREIAEETGITGAVESRLGTIDYWFSGDDRRIHKVVHHFLLRAIGGYLTVENDPDSEAEEAAWIEVDRLPERLSYPNERRLSVLAAQTLRSGRPIEHSSRTIVRTFSPAGGPRSTRRNPPEVP